MLCFSSSRWPFVVSTGTFGALPGPLWLWLSSGTGLMAFPSGFVIRFLHWTPRETRNHANAFRQTRMLPRLAPTRVFPPARTATAVIARLDRATQYSRGADDRTEKP